MLKEHGLPADFRSSLVLIEGDVRYLRSTAALRVLARLQAPYAYLHHAFLFVPSAVRDAVYSLVAHYRYSIFGQLETCRMPTAADKEWFVE